MHVTSEACAVLSDLLARRNEPERCLRLSTIQGKYRFILDEAIDQDVSFTHADRVVLVVSETVSRDLWGVTVDCADASGKRKLIFRRAKVGEPFDTAKEEPNPVPAGWQAAQHELLLAEIAEIGKQIASLRGGSKSLREQLQALEAAKQAKWDAIRMLWAGDGGWHKRNAGTMTAEAD